MKLSLGIIGLPNVGKSTLFKIITKNEVNIANYPFCTIDPNIGIVPVPDPRIEALAKMSASAQKIPAVVEFYDIAGLVRGAHKGEGLGNKFLSHIREVHALIHVIRCFSDNNITHVDASIDPLRDRETILQELILHDLEILESRIKKWEVEAKSGDKEQQKNLDFIKKLIQKLESGNIIGPISDAPFLKELGLLTAKRQLYFLNGKTSDISSGLLEKIKEEGSQYIIADLNEVIEVPELIVEAYKVLGLISFFTTGKEETRAWTIKQGMMAPEAAGVIHTDFEKKFIRAEVIGYKELLETGSWNDAQKKGKIRTEGKTYILKDGDVILIRHGA